MAKAYFQIDKPEKFFYALSVLKSGARDEAMTSVNKAGDILLAKTKAKLMPGKLQSSLYLTRVNAPISGAIIGRDMSGASAVELANYLTWHDDVRDYAAPLELGHMLVAWGRKTDKYVEPYQKTGYLRSTYDENEDDLAHMIIDGINKVLDGFGD